jgi:hypothetical protein
VCRVAWRLGRGRVASQSGFQARTLPSRGRPLRITKEALLTLSEGVTIAGALLLLPCVLAGLAFDCVLTEPLPQVVLLAAASTAILTGIAIHEGWYADHLSRLAGADEHPRRPTRLEPTFEQGRRSSTAPQEVVESKRGTP